MSLRQRVLTFLGITLALIMFIVLFFDVFLTKRYFSDYELRQRNLELAHNSIHNELEHLVSFLGNWSAKDDTYQYTLDQNETYIQNNLDDHALATARINYLAILDTQNHILFTRGYDFRRQKVLEFPSLTSDKYANFDFLHSPRFDSVAGLLQVPEGILLFAARPVLKSDFNGPPNGLFVIGRLLDSTMIAEISKNLQMKIYITAVSTMSAEWKEKCAHLGKWTEEFSTESGRRRELAGFYVIPDLYGKPTLLLQARIPRDMKPFLDAQYFGAVIKISAILCILLLFWWFLTKGLMKRIEQLNEQVTMIGDRADMSKRTQIVGSDELSGLANSINRMLDSLNRSRDTLRESDRRFRDILSNIRLIGYVLDGEGRILFCNKYLLEITGWTEAELLHASWFEKMIPSSMREMRASDFRESIQRGRFDPQELRDIVTKRGERRTVLFNITAMRNREGKAVGIAVIGEDITDRILAEAEIRRLAALVESATESIEITDCETNIIYVNPAFTKIMGYASHEVLGKPIAILNTKKQSPQEQAEIWSTVANGGIWNGKLFNARKDGKVVELDSTIVPLRDPGGTITHFGKFARDVTQQSELQAQLNRSQRFVAVGELTGGIAHNFNNVLTVIMGNIGLAKISEVRRARECLNEAEAACVRASDLIKQLMTFSRRTQIDKKPVAVDKLLQEVSTLVRSTFDRRIEIVLEDMHLQHCISGDSSQLHQVLLNMCFNAKDALLSVAGDHDRSLKITLGATELFIDELLIDAETRCGNYACISVADTGCGMSQETIKHIFEPFFTTKEIGKGTGLGLASAFGIVKQHDGWITVSSAVNIGSKFLIYIPVLMDAVAEAKPERVTEPVVRGSESILLVEDEEMVRNVGLDVLQRQGYRVTCATNGLEALNLLIHQPGQFDLIVLDISMPVMTGFEFMDEIVERKLKPRILLSTGVPFEELKPQYNDLVVGSVPKPYQPAELLRMIRKVLDDRNGNGKHLT